MFSGFSTPANKTPFGSSATATPLNTQNPFGQSTAANAGSVGGFGTNTLGSTPQVNSTNPAQGSLFQGAGTAANAQPAQSGGLGFGNLGASNLSFGTGTIGNQGVGSTKPTTSLFGGGQAGGLTTAGVSVGNGGLTGLPTVTAQQPQMCQSY
jgi:hypothetical protein